MTEAPDARTGNRARIVEVAATLLREEGRSAVTTRGVAERAGVQAPTIYRLFGDKDGLLDAVAEQAMTAFAAVKSSAVTAAAGEGLDPIEDLRTGWDMTIDFGLANPELFILISDPARGPRSPAAQKGMRLLAERIHRVARAGRLLVSEDEAVELVHAAGTGAILATLAKPEAERNHRLSDTMYDAVLARILAPSGSASTKSAGSTPTESADLLAPAIALRAHAADLDALSPSERALFADWLDRVIAHPTSDASVSG